MPTVELTRHLVAFFPQLGQTELRVEAATVREIIEQLERRAPGLGFYVCDERGRLRRHVNIFVDGERIQDREQLGDRVEPTARIFIVQALSGG